MNKRKDAMRVVRNIGLSVFTVALLAGLLACENPENPFKAGLGPVIDTRAPTITLSSPGAGNNIGGKVTFMGIAEDDYKLDSVWFMVTSHQTLDANNYKTWKQASLNEKSGDWSIAVDTSVFPDGNFLIKLWVKDTVGKEAITENIAFNIKNVPPEINLGYPSVTEGVSTASGVLSGAHLNWGVDIDESSTIPVEGNAFNRKVSPEGYITGIIRDNSGIRAPQYRMVKVDDSANNGTATAVARLNSTAWKTFSGRSTDKTNYTQTGGGSWAFTIDLENEGVDAETFYAIQLRVDSVDGSSCNYPRDYWSPANWALLTTEAQRNENSYVLIFLSSDTEAPILELYAFQDISQDPTGTAPSLTYPSLTGPGIVAPHKYVSEPNVSKNGSFELRVKAYHSQGIDRTVVYWENEDTKEKGRFIWNIPGGSSSGSASGGYVKNFVYTYNDNPTLDNGKIQRYTGSDANWNSKFENGQPFASFDTTDAVGGNWANYTANGGRLSEGTYNLEIVTTTASGSRTPKGGQLRSVITLDRTAPKVELNDIFYNDSNSAPKNAAGRHIVNGVVKAKVLFNETGTGFRSPDTTDAGYFTGGLEQLFIMVADTDKAVMDAYDGWPISAGALPVGLPFTALANGPVSSNNDFKVKTSAIATEGEPVPNVNGGNYLLYVFARDNAYNVGKASFPITVEKDTDKPKIDFGIGNIIPANGLRNGVKITNGVAETNTLGVGNGVYDPSPGADNQTTQLGFLVTDNGTIVRRNVLTASSEIRFRITDDDSLDLGLQGGTASPATVKITLATADSTGNVITANSANTITLGNDGVKEIFGTQTLTGTKRNLVNRKDITMTQQSLLKALKLAIASGNVYDTLFGGTPDAYNSLPSGIYKIEISVTDYAADTDIKLATTPTTANPTVSDTAEFWIAVDSTDPEGEITGIVGGVDDAKYISATQDVYLKGYVADQNGPLYLESVTITRQGGTTPSNITYDAPAVVNAERTSITSPVKSGIVKRAVNLANLPDYQADFAVRVNLSNNSGAFTFTLVFSDRFGNKKTLTKIFTSDNDPPTANLSGMINTFERNYADVVIPPSSTAIAEENKLRLTNGTVQFKVSAADPSPGKIDSVRWWLLPEGTVPSVNYPANYNDLFSPPEVPSAANVVSYGAGFAYGQKGEGTLSSGNYTVEVNTATVLATGGGVYNLFVAARDEAGNDSFPSSGTMTPVQTVYILQEEDKPYFREITPDGAVVGARGMIIQGSILEDDGFGTGAVKLWWSNNPNASATPSTNAAGDVTDTNYNGGVTVKSDHLTVSASGKSIRLNIDLRDTSYGFNSVASAGGGITGDGTKHVVLVATDSAAAKFGGDAAVTRSKHISFILDELDPTITLTSPIEGTVFGDNAATNFNLAGYIFDANLYVNRDGNYCIYLWCDGWPKVGGQPAASKEIILGSAVGMITQEGTTTGGVYTPGATVAGGYITSSVTVTVAGSPSTITTDLSAGRVAFSIPASAFAAPGMLNFAALEDGYRSISVSVKDKSDKEGSVSRSFVKDMTPPALTLTGIDELNLTLAQYTAGGKAWHDLLFPATNAKNIIVDSNRNILSFMIQDEYSTIDTTSFKYWFDTEYDDGDAGRTTLVTWNPTTPSGSVRGEIDLSTLTSGGTPDLSEGSHIVYFEVKDSSGNLKQTAYYAFVLDTQTPEQTITVTARDSTPLPTGSVVGMAANASGTLFTISGTAKDANLKDVSFRIARTDTGAQAFPVVVAGVTSSLSLVTSTDSRITPVVANRWTFATGTETLTWNFAFNRAAPTPAITLESGKSYDVIVIATDQLGNVSEQFVWSFVFTQDKPKITFDGGLQTNASTNLMPADAAARTNILSGSSPSIQGMVSDDYSPITGLQYKLEKFNYGNGSWDAGAWGDMSVVMPGLTLGASKQVPWKVPVSGGEGFYRIRIQAKNGAWNDNAQYNPAIGGTDYNTTDGPGNPQISSYVYFFYDTGAPNLQPDATSNYYSFRKENGTLVLTGTSIDDNRHRSITATLAVKRKNFTTDADAGDINLTGTWAPAALNTQVSDSSPWSITLTPPTDTQAFKRDSLDTGTSTNPYIADDNYTLKLVATDLAGMVTEVDIPITIDSTRPTGRVTAPMFQGAVPPSPPPAPAAGAYPYASVIVQGGQPSVITGETEDTSSNRSESGVKAIWYHLGFVDGNAAWPTPQTLWAAAGVPTGEVDSGKHSGLFDDKANATTGNAWFKLGGTQIPPGFVIENSNVFDWRITVDGIGGATIDPMGTGFKIYADKTSALTLKGRAYSADNNAGATGNPNGGTTIKLVERVQGSSDNYRLPLWLRVEDEAGNVNYFCQDIWIYPDADIPATTINNPQDAASSNPRGGSISADGTATNISSVYAVIYRVLADAGTTITADDAVNQEAVPLKNGAAPGTQGKDLAKMIALMPADYRSGGSKYLGGTWYIATPEPEWGSDKVPWNFVFNTDREINGLISRLGFPISGSGANNTIRVRLQVFVFKGAGADPERISTGDGGTIGNEKPYVRTFFLNDSAPAINTPMISPNGSTTPSLSYTSRVVRSGSFAVQAALQASSTNVSGRSISSIAIRRLDEVAGNTGWITYWQRTNATTGAYTAERPAGFVVNNVNTPTQFTYTLDSKSASVRNAGWANSGGRYRIEVRIRDNNTPAGEAFYTYEVGIDNFVPVADENITTSSKAAGTSVAFLGRALDYSGSDTLTPVDRKVDKIYAWFTKGSDFVNMKRDERVPTSSTTITKGSESAYENRKATVAGKAVTITAEGTPASITYPTDIDGGWMIELSQGKAMPGSGISWVPDLDQDITWSFNVNTLNLPDGPITLNYLIYDDAGNVSFYTQTTLIMNRYPVIDRVTLHTDNTGTGAVYTTHTGNQASSSYMIDRANMADGYLNSGFISKNKVIGFEVRTLSGNAPLNYRLQYVTRKIVPLTSTNLEAMIALKNGTALPGGTVLAATDVNLFTIKQIGDYGPADWRNIGVHDANIVAGSNFVFDNGKIDLADLMKSVATGDGQAQVWAYTPVISRDPITGVTDNTSVGPGDPARSFEFYGDTHFPTGGATSQANKIGQFDGSHPGGDGGTNDSSGTAGSGTAFFLIKVWDSVDTANPGEFNQLYDAVVVGMNVYLTDTKNPTSRLYDLNPYAEAAVTGNNITDANRTATIAEAAAPRGIGQNILRGGLFNINTNTDLVKSGHIEPRSGTTALQPSYFRPGAMAGSLDLGANDRFENRSANGRWAGDTSLNANHPDHDADTNMNTSFTVDQVSGRIILRGVAWDNQLIDEIQLYIGATAATTTTLHTTILKLADSGTNAGTMQPQVGQAYAREELHWKNGHIVEWAYVWDTTKTLAGAQDYTIGPMNISVRVKDKQGGTTGLLSDIIDITAETADSATAIESRKFHSTIGVNIVPYITGFQRDKKFATNRSRQGWYSFYRNESGIKALGYNLMNAAGGASTNMRVNTADNGTSGYNLTVTGRSRATTPTPADYTTYMDQVTFTVPNATASVSGQIDLWVGTTYTPTGTVNNALNHRTLSKGHSWNRESWRYTDGSDLWNNKPHAHIWVSEQGRSDGTALVANQFKTFFGDAGAANGSRELNSPGMALEYQSTAAANMGRLYATWAIYGTANYFYAHNYHNGTATNNRTAMHGGTPNDPYSETDIAMYNGTGVPNITAVYQNDGGPYVVSKTLMTTPTGTASTTNTIGTQTPSSNARLMSDTTGTRPTERWRNSRIAKAAANGGTDEGNAGRIYVTSYDSTNKYLLYSMRNGTGAATKMILDGNNTVDGNTAITANAINDFGTITQSTSAGEFSAVDYIVEGGNTIPVVAYYDAQNDTVRLVAGRSNNPGTGTNNWNRQYVIPADNALRNGSGKYISIKVDKGNNIHLAFYNSNYQTVVYAYAAARANNTSAFTFSKIHTVDTVVKSGYWTDISVDNYGNPWIVYGDTSRTGSYDGVRMAYKSGSDTGTHFTGRYMECKATHTDISEWEAMTMPADFTIKNDRLNIEAWPPTDRANYNQQGNATWVTGPGWKAAIGYASDMYRIAYFNYPGYKGANYNN